MALLISFIWMNSWTYGSKWKNDQKSETSEILIKISINEYKFKNIFTLKAMAGVITNWLPQENPIKSLLLVTLSIVFNNYKRIFALFFLNSYKI